jgi:hypothetical protein
MVSDPEVGARRSVGLEFLDYLEVILFSARKVGFSVSCLWRSSRGSRTCWSGVPKGLLLGAL